MKECKKCLQILPLDHFYKGNFCKKCFNFSRRRSCICSYCGITYFPDKKGSGRFCSFECRFFDKIIFTSNCWLWKGSLNRNRWGKRYGTFQMGKKNELAHRVSYIYFKGPISSPKIICHTCDVEKCVNPAHLWQGTYEENMKDMILKNRNNYIGQHPDKCIFSKLNLQTATSIRIRLQKGELPKHLAVEYCVSPKAIRNILNNITWTYQEKEQEQVQCQAITQTRH